MYSVILIAGNILSYLPNKYGGGPRPLVIWTVSIRDLYLILKTLLLFILYELHSITTRQNMYDKGFLCYSHLCINFSLRAVGTCTSCSEFLNDDNTVYIKINFTRNSSSNLSIYYINFKITNDFNKILTYFVYLFKYWCPLIEGDPKAKSMWEF